MAREEPSAAGAWERDDVLEIGRRGGERADRHRVGKSVAQREHEDAYDARAELEPARPEIAVRDRVAKDVQREPGGDRGPPRPERRARKSARRDVQTDDHGAARAFGV